MLLLKLCANISMLQYLHKASVADSKQPSRVLEVSICCAWFHNSFAVVTAIADDKSYVGQLTDRPMIMSRPNIQRIIAEQVGRHQFITRIVSANACDGQSGMLQQLFDNNLFREWLCFAYSRQWN